MHKEQKTWQYCNKMYAGSLIELKMKLCKCSDISTRNNKHDSIATK